MTDLRKAVKHHIKDLRRVASLIELYPQFNATKTEVIKAADMLEAALAQPEQEPVAWNGWVLREVFFENGEPCGHREPPSKPWVSLTDEEINDASIVDADGYAFNFAKAIEAALKERNNG